MPRSCGCLGDWVAMEGGQGSRAGQQGRSRGGRRLLTVFGSRSVDADIDVDNQNKYICLMASGLPLTWYARFRSSRWDWQATVDLLQQSALLHATGPLQVGGNRGTGCGQITVRRSVGSRWTRLHTWVVLSHHHPPAPTPPPKTWCSARRGASICRAATQIAVEMERPATSNGYVSYR